MNAELPTVSELPVRTAALFDFDETLIKGDSMLAFVYFLHGRRKTWWGLLRLLPMWLTFKLGWLPRQQAKERFLTYFMGNMEARLLEEMGAKFAVERLPDMVRPLAIEHLQAHQAAGHACWMVTASLPFWTQAWALQHGLHLVASSAEVRNGVFTGHLAGPNCYGQEKVNRIEAALGAHEEIHTVAYGDSKGDQALLAWADAASYRPFRGED